ncbi:MAG: ATP-binding cassette domain-containing protein [Lachnospiraceae bacterium]|nr:ATP-binding cassette domain-containing protein [Lachnospiraceae bacterium]
MIQFEQVTKIYETTGETVLRNLSFAVHKGELLFVTGESGTGKSTIIRLILKEIDASSGTIRVSGKNLQQISHGKIPRYRQNIGVVFQDSFLLKDKTVFENVAFAQEVIGKSGKYIERQVTSVLSLLGLAKKYHQYPGELSGGEQQKVCLARAIVNQPQILLADEPTGNLDPESSTEIMNLLSAIQRRGTTVLVVTHDIEQVNRLTYPVLCLDGIQKVYSPVSV